MLLDNSSDGVGKGLTGIPRISDQDYASRFHGASKHQPSEIFILSQQDAVFSSSKFYQLPIIRTPHNLVNGIDIESISAQSTDNSKVTTLIGQEA